MIRMGKGSKESEMEDTPMQPISVTGQNQQSFQAQEPQYRSAVAQDSAPAATKAISESESIARSIKDGTMSGYVGTGTSLSGEVTFKAMWRIDGQFSGRIASENGTIIVGNSGQVDANVEVAIATIHGSVNGDVVASQRIELGRTARVNGNIQTPSLTIEQGAVFEGSCRMLQAIATVEKENGAVVRESYSSRERAVPAPPAVEAQPAIEPTAAPE
jgi:cytoskeletal protein CcmA (bactofilin family)